MKTSLSLRNKVMRTCFFIAIAPLVFGSVHDASAARRPVQKKKVVVADACVSSICIEADTGLVLSELNADEKRPAASMVKMMLFLLVSEGLQQGKWTLDTPVVATEHAQSMGGSQVQLEAGETMALDHLMRAVAIVSANDAAVAVADGLWGSSEVYLEASNRRAQELGMIDSHFHSVNGLPPSAGQLPDSTTARDMSILAQWCVRHPRILIWSNTRELIFREGEPSKRSTNALLDDLPGCDGLKTGFTNAAGWCISTTAQRDGIRLITVVMGGTTSRARFRVAQQTMEDGFARVRKVKLVARGNPIDAITPVTNCETEEIQLTAADDLWAIVKVDDVDKLRLAVDAPATLTAPLRAGTQAGTIRVELTGKKLAEVPLTVPMDLNEAGWRWKLKNSALREVKGQASSGS
jgi:D-alanyl-D-alanine carboxypeptidase (penicillin-binding protein 5/6)